MTKAPSQDEAHAAIKAILKTHSVLARNKNKEAREELIYDILEYIAKTGQAFKNMGFEDGINATANLSQGIMATILSGKK